MPQARLHQVEFWIFDLDNTLYPPSAGLFAQIDKRMTDFIARELGVERGEADRLRGEYWQAYGTTMAGLSLHHGIAADRFLSETHDLDYSGLRHEASLAEAISALPGKKLIHTNGPRCHAEAVLTALEYNDLFDHAFTLEDADLVSKPDPLAFEAMYAKVGVEPANSAMIEDDPSNLVVPHSRSVQTIWLDHHSTEVTPDHVRHHIDDLNRFLRSAI